MSKSTLVAIIALSVVALATGYNYFFQPLASVAQPEVTAAPAPSPTLTPSQAQLAALSPRERVLQILAVPLEVPTSAIPATPSTSTSSATPLVAAVAEDREWIAANRPGTVVLFGTRISTSSAQQLIQELDQQPGLPVWVAVDHEGGTVQRLSGTGFTRLPSWQAFCQSDPSDQRAWLASASAELQQVGVDIVLGPVVDVASRSAALGTRVCSGEYEVTTQAALEYLEVFTQAGLMPVLKHFPGIGAVRRDLHVAFDTVTVTAPDALLYRLLIGRYPDLGVMVSHAGVANQFSEVPCSLSASCVGELASQFPQTLVITDALDMKAAGYQQGNTELLTLAERALAALKAGNQLLLFGQQATPKELDQVVETLVTAYASEDAVKQQIDAAAEKILDRKLKENSLTPPAKP